LSALHLLQLRPYPLPNPRLSFRQATKLDSPKTRHSPSQDCQTIASSTAQEHAKQGRRKREGAAQDERAGVPTFLGVRRAWTAREQERLRGPDSTIRSTNNVVPQPNQLLIPPSCTSVRATHRATASHSSLVSAPLNRHLTSSSCTTLGSSFPSAVRPMWSAGMR
jgi:hypothetical protein